MLGGIDEAPGPLALAQQPTGDRWAVTPEEPGRAARVAQFQAVRPTRRGLDATGRSPRAVGAARAAAALPRGVRQPRQGRDCATAPGQGAPTDALAARAGAPWAAAGRPGPRPLPAAQPAALRAVLARRRPRRAMRPAEPQRLEPAPRRLRADIEAHLAGLQQRVAARADDLAATRRGSPVWRARFSRRGPGMGLVWARTLVRALPAWGT